MCTVKFQSKFSLEFRRFLTESFVQKSFFTVSIDRQLTDSHFRRYNANIWQAVRRGAVGKATAGGSGLRDAGMSSLGPHPRHKTRGATESFGSLGSASLAQRELTERRVPQLAPRLSPTGRHHLLDGEGTVREDTQQSSLSSVHGSHSYPLGRGSVAPCSSLAVRGLWT